MSTKPTTKKIFLPTIIIAAWALIYLPNLRTSPGWYGDEFLSLNLGEIVLQGKTGQQVPAPSFFSLFFNYQPWAATFYTLGARILAGGDILGARLVAASCALIIAFIAFWFFRKNNSDIFGILCALLLLAAPENATHFRWVYTHHFVSIACLLIGITLLAQKEEDGWLLGLYSSIAAFSHLLVANVVVGCLLVSFRRPKSWLKILLPSSVIIAVTLLWGHFKSNGHLFDDLKELALIYADSSATAGWIGKLDNCRNFFFRDLFHPFLLFGFLFLFILKQWRALAFSLFISLSVIQNRANLPVFYYQAMIFAPLLIVNTFYGLARIHEAKAHSRIGKIAIIFLGSAFPIAMFFMAATHSLKGTHHPANQFWVAPSSKDLEKTAEWINQNVNPNDLVIAHWDIGWKLRCRWTDIQHSAVWEYQTCPIIFNRLRDRGEFMGNASLSSAKYIFIGQPDLRWAFHQGTVPMLLKEYQVEAWPIVFRTDSTLVLQNPKL